MISRKDFRANFLGDFRSRATLTRNQTVTHLSVTERQAPQQRWHDITKIHDGRKRRCCWRLRQGHWKSTKSYCSDCNVERDDHTLQQKTCLSLTAIIHTSTGVTSNVKGWRLLEMTIATLYRW
nr:uncharacterized protein LOC113810049 [Penaeus vannamei]